MMNNSFLAATFAVSVVTVTAAPVRAQNGGGFPDVPASHWAAQSVTKLASAGIVKGYPAAPLAPVGQAKPAGGKKQGYDGDKPVTRYELAVTLYRFVQYIERADRQKKGKTGAMAEPKTGADAAKYLVANGFLPKTTPLAKDGAKLVTANQFADALAQVIAKSRERVTPISPDSELDIKRPQAVPGT